MKKVGVAVCILSGLAFTAAVVFTGLGYYVFATLRPGHDPSSDLLVRPEYWAKTSPATISKEQALSDIAVLQRIIDRGYIGRRLGEDDAQWNRIFDDLRVGVAAMTEPVAVSDLWELLQTHLATVNDCHFAARYRDEDGAAHRAEYCAKKKTFVADLDPALHADETATANGATDAVSRGSDFVDCPTLADQPIPSVFATVENGEISFEGRLALLTNEAPGQVKCRFRGPDGSLVEAVADFRHVRPQPRAAGKGVEEIGGANVPFFRVSTFDATKEAEFGKLLVDVWSAARNAPVMLLDFRGNHGGTDARRYFLAMAIGAGGPRPPFASLTSETSEQGLINRTAFEISSARYSWLHRFFSRFRLALLVLRQQFTCATKAGSPYSRLRPERSAPPTGRRTAKRIPTIVLLQDRGCASACELFVLLLRRDADVITVGDATSGALRDFDPGWYQLPATRITVTVPHEEFNLDPETFAEGVGLSPDIWFETPIRRSDLEALANCAASPECRQSLSVIRDRHADVDAGRVGTASPAPHLE